MAIEGWNAHYGKRRDDGNKEMGKPDVTEDRVNMTRTVSRTYPLDEEELKTLEKYLPRDDNMPFWTEKEIEEARRRVNAREDPAQELKYEGEVDAGRYEVLGIYRKGAHSVIYRAMDNTTGNIVAIKKHEHFMPAQNADPKEIRDAEQRFRREAEILSNLKHPGIVNAYGFFFKEDDFQKKPYLVTELIEQDSLEEMMQKGKTFNEQDAREVILSVGTPIHYLHTHNGRPILHRDLKPDNIKVMQKDARWPHKIVDFSESKLGKATLSGSVTGTIGYNAPEIYGGGMADQSADFYSLARIASHMLIGDNQKFMDSWFGNTSLREMKNSEDLNVSEEFLRAVERATSRDPSHRYKTLTDLTKDLGYNISRVPESREELEAILGHKSLPVKVETKSQKPEWYGDGNGPGVLGTEIDPDPKKDSIDQRTGFNTYRMGDVLEPLSNYIDPKTGIAHVVLTGFDDGNGPGLLGTELVERGSSLPVVEVDEYGTLTIDGFSIRRENSIYNTLKRLRGTSFYMRKESNKSNYPHPLVAGNDSKLTLAYLQHAAQENPILREVLNGRKTLEEIAREKNRGWFNKTLSHFTSGLLERDEVYPTVKRIDDILDNADETLNKRRAELLKIFGSKPSSPEDKSASYGLGFLAGMTTPYLTTAPFDALSSLINGATPHAGIWILLHGALGSIALPNILEARQSRKLKKKAREMDSWIREARRETGLEKKVESVELTDPEKFWVKYKSGLSYITMTASPMLASLFGLLATGDSLPQKIGLGYGAVLMISHIFDLPLTKNYQNNIENYFTERKLKQKRLAAGLPEDGMEKMHSVRIEGASKVDYELVNSFMELRGLKSGRGYDRDSNLIYTFSNKDIRVEGKYSVESGKGSYVAGEGNVLDLEINATPKARDQAKQIAKMLKAGIPFKERRPIEMNLLKPKVPKSPRFEKIKPTGDWTP